MFESRESTFAMILEENMLRLHIYKYETYEKIN